MSQHLHTGPVALVTGAGRAEGLGYAVCGLLADAGFRVVLTARDATRAEALAAQLRAQDGARRLDAAALDVTDASAVHRLADHLDTSYGRLDVLVNNAAGVVPYGERAATADLETAAAVMHATLFGA